MVSDKTKPSKATPSSDKRNGITLPKAKPQAIKLDAIAKQHSTIGIAHRSNENGTQTVAKVKARNSKGVANTAMAVKNPNDEPVKLKPETAPVPAKDYSALRTGLQLRHARLARKLDVDTIANKLRIRREFLQALEEGNLKLLPGFVYAIGFLRTYAEFLGLDGQVLIDQFKSETQTKAVKTEPELHKFDPMDKSVTKIPLGKILFGGGAVVALALFLWFFFSESPSQMPIAALPDTTTSAPQSSNGDPAQKNKNANSNIFTNLAGGSNNSGTNNGSTAAGGNSAAPSSTALPDQKTAVPPAVIPMTRPPTPLATKTAPSNSVNTPTVPNTAITAKPSDKTSVTANANRATTAKPIEKPVPTFGQGIVVNGGALRSLVPNSSQTVVAATPVPPKPAATGATSATAAKPESPVILKKPPVSNGNTSTENPVSDSIVLTAKSEAWIEIHRADNNKLVKSLLLLPGASFVVPKNSGLTLSTGNAGGLAISVNGITVAPLGEVGKVKRGISLDPESLLK